MKIKKTYAFAVDFEQEEDGLWSVDVPAVPACAASGYSKKQALEALQDLTQAYFDVLIQYNDPLPEGIESYKIVLGSERSRGAEVVTVNI